MNSNDFTGRHTRRREDFAESVQRRKNDLGLKVSDILERVGRHDIEGESNANS